LAQLGRGDSPPRISTLDPLRKLLVVNLVVLKLLLELLHLLRLPLLLLHFLEPQS
jgi:hypothetical protein